MYAKWWAAALALTAACTKKNPGHCAGDSDCSDATPFCDVDGAYDESDHTPNTCTVVPADCPLERCGCTPGTAVSCDGDQLATCAADSKSTTATTCALGCSDAAKRCASFEPSNGLGNAMRASASDPAVVLPKGATIDTDLGLVRDAGGTTLDVKSETVMSSGKPIRVFHASSFVIDDLVASGTNALAFVAAGDISIIGVVDVGARGVQAGPGGQSTGTCNGTDSMVMTQVGNDFSEGPGGAGNGTAGAPGGIYTNGTVSQGGAPYGGFEPLVGGCRGGRLFSKTGDLATNGGGGGGAIELASATSVRLSSRGFLTAGGGGGPFPGGAGSGGLILIEAPTVQLSGATTGFATNGGASGCGPANGGVDGGRSSMPATGPGCNGAGSGGTREITPVAGASCSGNCFVSGSLPGGGGAVGRARIATTTGSFEQTDAPYLGAILTTAMLVPN